MAEESPVESRYPTHRYLHPLRPVRAFTLFELLLVVAILGALALIAYPSYTQYIDKANIAQAKVDIVTIEQTIDRWYAVNLTYPDTLADVGMDTLKDPWGNPYYYTNVQKAGHNVGSLRKDKFLHPLNSDYDLYSKGKDGKSQLPLTALVSYDDIIRANNGAFIDLASNY
jgi:general secretion pathway protein G